MAAQLISARQLKDVDNNVDEQIGQAAVRLANTAIRLYQVRYMPTRVLRDPRYYPSVWCCYPLRARYRIPGTDVSCGAGCPVPRKRMVLDPGTDRAYGAMSGWV